MQEPIFPDSKTAIYKAQKKKKGIFNTEGKKQIEVEHDNHHRAFHYALESKRSHWTA